MRYRASWPEDQAQPPREWTYQKNLTWSVSSLLECGRSAKMCLRNGLSLWANLSIFILKVIHDCSLQRGKKQAVKAGKTWGALWLQCCGVVSCLPTALPEGLWCRCLWWTSTKLLWYQMLGQRVRLFDCRFCVLNKNAALCGYVSWVGWGEGSLHRRNSQSFSAGGKIQLRLF